ncbi:hypothetical protein HDA40_004157 [Hamadaea flava]|uniref:Uncharacterized protein n=1 Tax=Hamadaea flava TaxID=1742688 RepID=A0ABV8LIQ5_9ACTN|nr:hypothetical protein [Hamadaea flava]MCP2325650.1 hypothetical protein [Hamadaea flava]
MITALPFIVAAVVTLGYAWLCWLRPFRPCPMCKGQGWKSTRILRRPKTCRLCGGDGWRLRLGRRLFNHLRRTRLAAVRSETTLTRTINRAKEGTR